jgi:hypothetical protein
MLRITEHDASDRLTLQLGGRLAGAWIGTLEDCWRGWRAAAFTRI